MPMWVKICANTNLHDAQLAADFGADALGFVFAPSKRRVNAEQVAAITRFLPSGVSKVGVFATGDLAEIAKAVQLAGLTAVQVHGTFDSEFLNALRSLLGPDAEIIQTVAYEVDASDQDAADALFVERLRAAMMHPAVDRILIDAARSGVSGGLGVAFDWTHAASLLQMARKGTTTAKPVILAGGLRPENVEAAVAALQPDGVDVASGVEARPGLKEPERLRAFLAAARG